MSQRTHQPDATVPRSEVVRDVARGLGARPKTLPPYLFYDELGSALYEQITELPEYYLTRAEREILADNAGAIVDRVGATEHGLHVVELGAGTAAKTQLLLSAIVDVHGYTHYTPIDVSRAALEEAAQRLRREVPGVRVHPIAASHEKALDEVPRVGARRLVLFIGSSIGNYEDDAAVELLTCVREHLEAGDALLLGTDWLKEPARLVAAYDDAQGVTAAFNKNLLTRINRELVADFDPERFTHRAIWNEDQARIEMHLESACEQVVSLGALGMRVGFARGERLHTESSAKYDLPRVDRLLEAAGFTREHTYFDRGHSFAVHLARVPH